MKEKIDHLLEEISSLKAESKEKVEEELASVKPMVEEAKKAVSGINKSNLDELKSMKMPPEPVHNVLTAVLRVFKT